MPALRLSDKPKPLSLPQIESRIPKPDELVVLSKPLLDATITIGKTLLDCTNKWAFGGDVAEVISGVNVQANHIAILTTSEGGDELARKLPTRLRTRLRICGGRESTNSPAQNEERTLYGSRLDRSGKEDS